jgi:uncharacterized membrane protein
MQSSTKRALTRFLIFALIGLLIEVFFTGVSRILKGNLSGHGHTSPLMMIDYGLLGVVVMPMARLLIKKKIPLVFRAVVYMFGIYFIELTSGFIFDKCGIHIWSYSDHMINIGGHEYPANIGGYITAYYAPFWWGLGLVSEYLNKKMDAVAALFLSGLTADELVALIENRSK